MGLVSRKPDDLSRAKNRIVLAKTEIQRQVVHGLTGGGASQGSFPAPSLPTICGKINTRNLSSIFFDSTLRRKDINDPCLIQAIVPTLRHQVMLIAFGCSEFYRRSSILS